MGCYFYFWWIKTKYSIGTYLYDNRAMYGPIIINEGLLQQYISRSGKILNNQYQILYKNTLYNIIKYVTDKNNRYF